MGGRACAYHAGSLNSMVLRADLGRSLNGNIPLRLGVSNLLIVLLAGAATSAIRPVSFVRLALGCQVHMLCLIRGVRGG